MFKIASTYEKQVVRMDQNAEYTAIAKWGDAATGGSTGFQVVPDVLVKNQHRLGLSSTDLAVLLNILMHWWSEPDLPFPRPSTIARNMGVSVRTVERSIQKMQGEKLISRRPSESKKVKDGSITVRRYELSGLRSKLIELAN